MSETETTSDASGKKNNFKSFVQHVFRAYGKSLTWRAAASVDTFTLTLIATHDPWRAGAVVLSENMTKTVVLYPLHELVWNRIPFGLENGYISRARSLAKAVTWRVAGSADTMMLTWFYTGHIKTAAYVAGAELFTKIPLYYVHERIWKRLGHEQLWEKTSSLLGRLLQKPPSSIL